MRQEGAVFHMEAAGSLTPELEGAPRSAPHRRRTKEKGRVHAHEARKEKAKALFLDEKQTR